MCIREQLEENEHKTLRPCAQFSDTSRGRDRYEEPCEMRMIYQRDRDRILHSKSFRRLKQKTQVFLSPEGDHYRTRMTHTLEVAQIGRSIARALFLNEDLVEAIAYGHDIGHTPFGHAGERALDAICSAGFAHNEQSIRVVEKIEDGGKGLNLAWEVRDGILNHKTSGNPSTLEGKIIKFSDKIAYINHDIDDAIRGRILKETDIPKEYRDVLGDTTKSRLNTMICDIIDHSKDIDDIEMSEEVYKTMQSLRTYMFEHVYLDSAAKKEEYKAERMVQELFEHYLEHVNELPVEYVESINKGENPEIVVCDYIAGMTDTYATWKFKELYIPKAWGVE